MALFEIQLEIDSTELSPTVEKWLQAARERVQKYWDQFPQKPLSQYIECDFDLVAAAIQECCNKQMLDGKLFIEWGCGFGVITGVASVLGLDAIGVEAEAFLCEEGEKLFSAADVQAEIWNGNFLPDGSRELSEPEDPMVSLTHQLSAVYDDHDFALEDFAMVFVYPWPGEEHFLKLVFDSFARSGALLLLYRGPYQIELYRKK